MDLFFLSLVLFGQGLLTGITLTLMVGPVTMVIMKYGMQVNRTAGILAAGGTWVSDFAFIFITYWLTFSISSFIRGEEGQFWIYLAGGSGLLVIGLMMVLSVKRKAQQAERVSIRNYTSAFINGFMVNSLSPFTLFFWVGAAVYLRLQHDQPAWYYAGLMLTLALGDMIKALLAPRVSRWIHERYMHWVHLIAGAVISATGVYVIGKGLIG